MYTACDNEMALARELNLLDQGESSTERVVNALWNCGVVVEDDVPVVADDHASIHRTLDPDAGEAFERAETPTTTFTFASTFASTNPFGRARDVASQSRRAPREARPRHALDECCEITRQLTTYGHSTPSTPSSRAPRFSSARTSHRSRSS